MTEARLELAVAQAFTSPERPRCLLVWLLLPRRCAADLSLPTLERSDLPMPAAIATKRTRARRFDARRAFLAALLGSALAGACSRQPETPEDARAHGQALVRAMSDRLVKAHRVHGQDPRYANARRAEPAGSDGTHVLRAPARSGGLHLDRRSARRPRLVRRRQGDAGVAEGEGLGARQGRRRPSTARSTVSPSASRCRCRWPTSSTACRTTR